MDNQCGFENSVHFIAEKNNFYYLYGNTEIFIYRMLLSYRLLVVRLSLSILKCKYSGIMLQYSTQQYLFSSVGDP
jgi:hypothetical protein